MSHAEKNAGVYPICIVPILYVDPFWDETKQDETTGNEIDKDLVLFE